MIRIRIGIGQTGFLLLLYGLLSLWMALLTQSLYRMIFPLINHKKERESENDIR